MLSINYEEDSSSDDSTAEELSDSECEDVRTVDYAAFSARYMGEITSLLGAHSHVNCENALTLNLEMQQRLQEVRKRLQDLLQAVKQRYLSNEHRLKLNMGKQQRGFGIRGAYLKGGTFFFKGNMFFKDLKCRNCPNNQDYEYRKNVEGEMFPMDFELCSRHVWSLLDKKAIVQAVKEQVIDYLADCKFRDKNNKTKKLTREIKVHTEKLSDLLAQVEDKFQIDWEQVSAHNLNYRHSPSSCKTMWQVYLHPSLKRSAWSVEENKMLLQAAQAHSYQNWGSIAKVVPKRSDYQCFIQYQTSVSFMDTQRWGRWDKRDDTKLLELIEKKTMNGVIDWNAVAAYFPHKPKKSLHQRYIYYLDPKISHVPFTPEEDLILLAAVEEYGEKFALLPRTLFPNRSITQLRMRYRNTLQTRHKLAPWTVEDDKKLMEFVSEHGTSAWLRCSEKLGNHNRISCRTRFLTIKKFFSKDPEATLEDIPRKKTCVMKNSVITTQNWLDKVSELRENPDTVLVPSTLKDIKMKQKSEKLRKQVEKKELKKQEPPKCEVVAKPSKRKKKTIRYVDRLRAVEQRLYHYFKYAFNFRLGTDVCTKAPNALLRLITTSLDFQLDLKRPYVADPLLSPDIGRPCKFYLQQNSTPDNTALSNTFGYTLPPSWPTATAFRALCIQSAQVPLEDSKNMKVSEEQKLSEFDKHKAVQRFRKRMQCLFYKTALLSRLAPARFTELMHKPNCTTTEGESVIALEIVENTITSTVETSSETAECDLNCVKMENPTEHLANDEANVIETLPSTKVLGKKKKKTEKRPAAVKRKRIPQKTQSTEAHSEIVSTVNAASEGVVYQITYVENSTQDDLQCLDNDNPQTGSDSSLLAVPENSATTSNTHTLTTAGKNVSVVNSPSEAEPPKKRVHIDGNSCNKSDFMLANIKTEFEI